LLGVADDPQRAHVLVEFVEEEVVRQVERQGEDTHQVVGKPVHAAVVVLHHRLEAGGLGRPDIRMEEVRGFGALVVLAARHVDRAHIDHLLEVCRRRFAEARRERLALERGVAARDVGGRHLDRQLVFDRQLEEGRRRVVGAVDRLLGRECQKFCVSDFCEG
jgi:hypothetical protein